MGCAGGSAFGAGISLLCLAAGGHETSCLGDPCSASTAGRQMSRLKIWIPVFTGKPRFLGIVGLILLLPPARFIGLRSGLRIREVPVRLGALRRWPDW